MCGIFGAIKFNGFFNKGDFQKFSTLTDLVSYRGPDSSDYRVFNGKGSVNLDERFNIFLGHRRLSIIDLSEAGSQPLSDGEDLWIIFNGEIFNYIELREELRGKGYNFRTKTDTEVILKVYREYGAKGFGLLNGMWAFALVDLRNKKLFLSRDRFSIKPLYLHRTAEALYFASEIKQLLPVLGHKEVNLNVMYAYLNQGLIDINDETFYKDIYKIKPMHTMTVDLTKNSMDETQYWDYCAETIPSQNEDIVEKFRDIFIDSVKIRLRSDVPVGCLLSGGLDSSSISVIANTLTRNGINCFSAISLERKYSESKYINILRHKNRLKLERLFLKPYDAWNCIEKVIWHNDEPCGGFSVIAQNQILELIRASSDIKVVLSGQGGDELLCGYRKFFFFYLKELFKHGKFFDSIGEVFFSLLHRTVLWQFSASEAKRYVRILQNNNTGVIRDILTFKGSIESVWNVASIRERQILDIDRYSVPALTHYEDRNSMAYGLEIRLPFLDHRLVNFALSLPDSLKVRHGWTKYVLRKALRELPREIAWRRTKQGFLTPEEKWLKNDFKEKIVELFNSSMLSELGLIRKDKLLKFYKDFINSNNLISRSDITRFVMAEIWARKFL